jgi:hypothetical protein
MDMILGFLETDMILTIAHVFGAILGAGGAFTSDGMFFSAVKDGKITKTEMRFLHVGSALVVAGLAVLIVSGSFLFLLDTEKYLASTKFLAKVTIVAIIAANGVAFHFFHLPLLRKNLGVPFRNSPAFKRVAPYLLASGVVSTTSWISAVILGSLTQVPYSYGTIMAIYLGVIAIGVTGTVLMKGRMLKL